MTICIARYSTTGSPLFFAFKPRIGEAKEIADVASWLVDGAPEWMTGQIIGVNGGLGTIKPQESIKV